MRTRPPAATARRSTDPAAAIRALPPFAVPPGDLRAAFDAVRAEPAVADARAAARTRTQRDAVGAAIAALVARSAAAASRRAENLVPSDNVLDEE